MVATFRPVAAAALLGLLLLPAAALGATVERDDTTGVITITGEAANEDDIGIEETAALHIVSRDGGGLTENSVDCDLVMEKVQCVKGSSLSIASAWATTGSRR